MGVKGRVEFSRHRTAAKDMGARTEVQEFLDLGGQEHHRPAARRKLPQVAVKVQLGPDVDAARRIVQDQHTGFLGKGASDEHLLLVAAR